MIFAVFDVLLAVNMCINYSFFTFISDMSCVMLIFKMPENVDFLNTAVRGLKVTLQCILTLYFFQSALTVYVIRYFSVAKLYYIALL